MYVLYQVKGKTVHNVCVFEIRMIITHTCTSCSSSYFDWKSVKLLVSLLCCVWFCCMCKITMLTNQTNSKSNRKEWSNTSYVFQSITNTRDEGKVFFAHSRDTMTDKVEPQLIYVFVCSKFTYTRTLLHVRYFQISTYVCVVEYDVSSKSVRERLKPVRLASARRASFVEKAYVYACTMLRLLL